MDIVIDTSAILAVILEEPERKRIVELTSGHQLLAPGSVPWEIGNAFSAMFKRQRISSNQAQEGLKIFESIPVRYTFPKLGSAVQLAHDNSIYAYDAYILECAKRFNAPLLTLDRRLHKVALTMGLPCLEV